MHACLHVPAPEALADRVLVSRALPQSLVKPIAITLFCLAALAVLSRWVADPLLSPIAAKVLPPTHPGVLAIREVIHQRGGTWPSEELSGAAQARLGRFGLAASHRHTTVRYVGTCHIEPAHACEHIAVSSADASGNVLLLSELRIPRLLVADDGMVALLKPVSRGTYIVVARSPQIAQRLDSVLKATAPR